MTIKTVLTKYSGQLPLHFIIIAAMVGQILLVVGLTGWLSFRHGQWAANELANQVRQEVTQRICQHLKNYLAVPHLVNQTNVDAIKLGLLDLNNLNQVGRYLWHQIQTFNTVSYIGLATAQGEYVGAQMRDNGTVILEFLTNTQPGQLQTWETDNQGYPTTRSSTVLHYDPRQRPWYQTAIIDKGPVWSDIYVYVSGVGTSISANQPIMDAQSQLLAVATTDLTLRKVGNFLNSLQIGRTGQAFILERSGLLVATSTAEKPYRKLSDAVPAQRFAATTSNDLLTQLTARYLQQHFGQLTQIQQPTQLELVEASHRYFLQTVPYQDQWGLDWLIVVVLPAADVMAPIYANAWATLMLCLLAVVVAIGLSIAISRRIVQPLHQLNIAAQQLAIGYWEQTLPIARNDEIGHLARSFQQMVEQLKQSFDTLAAQNVQLRVNERKLVQFLEAIPVGVFVFDANGSPYYANQIAQQLLGKGVIPAVTAAQLSEVYQAYLVDTQHFYPSHRLPVVRALWGEATSIDDIEIHREDKIIPLEVWGTPIIDDYDKIIFALVAFQDITLRKQATLNQQRFTERLEQLNQQLAEYSRTLEEKVLARTAELEQVNQELQRLARIDGLTQVANRRFFDECLQLEWNILRREQLPLSLILGDIDYFKRYNDGYGHPAGDECLRQVAQALKQSVKRPADLVARYGGEEFAIVMPNTPAKGAWHVATLIQAAIKQLNLVHAYSPVSDYVTMSFGIASLIPSLSVLPEVLIIAADKGLYEAKKLGRNRIVDFSTDPPLCSPRLTKEGLGGDWAISSMLESKPSGL